MNTTPAISEKERYQRYLCSREWAVLKEAVRKRSGGICERCHLHPMDHVHHLTYVRKYQERLEDLQAQCIPCHEFTHAKRDRDPILDAPPVLCGRQINSVYLAGRISLGNDAWRRDIMPGWSMSVRGGGQSFSVKECNCDDEVELPDGRSITYCGPYWLDVLGGHGGGIGPHAFGDDDEVSGHGGPSNKYGSISNPVEVVGMCRSCIFSADLVFAWVDSRECHGTLLEIGWADAVDKIVVVAVPKWDRELWLACAMADRFVMADSAGKAWEWLWRNPTMTHHLGSVVDYEPDPDEDDSAF